MVFLREILKTYLEEQLLIKYYMIKYLILLKIQNMMDTCVDLLHWFLSALIKGRLFTETGINSENQQLTDELHKRIIRQFVKCKAYSYFNGNILAAGLAHMGLIKFLQPIFILCY